jgi:hypothetical protein
MAFLCPTFGLEARRCSMGENPRHQETAVQPSQPGGLFFVGEAIPMPIPATGSLIGSFTGPCTRSLLCLSLQVSLRYCLRITCIGIY